MTPIVLVPAGQDRSRQDGAGDHARRADHPGPRRLRRLPPARARTGQGLPGRAGQLGQPGATRGAEDGGLRGRRLPRRRPRRPRPPGRQRRQHRRLLAWLPSSTPTTRASKRPIIWGYRRRRRPDRAGEVVPNPETVATAIRIGNPASWMLAEAARDESGGVIEAVSRPGDPQRAARPRGQGRRASSSLRRPLASPDYCRASSVDSSIPVGPSSSR